MTAWSTIPLAYTLKRIDGLIMNKNEESFPHLVSLRVPGLAYWLNFTDTDITDINNYVITDISSDISSLIFSRDKRILLPLLVYIGKHFIPICQPCRAHLIELWMLMRCHFQLEYRYNLSVCLLPHLFYKGSENSLMNELTYMDSTEISEGLNCSVIVKL